MLPYHNGIKAETREGESDFLLPTDVLTMPANGKIKSDTKG